MNNMNNINDCFKYINIGLPEDIMQLKWSGNLEEAVKVIDKRLESNEISEALKYDLIAQREMIVRLPDSYSFTVDEALEKIQKDIPDFTKEELNDYLDNRRIEWIYLNGQKRLIRSFLGTLNTYEDFAKRKGGYKGNNINESFSYKTALKMKEKGYSGIKATIRHKIKLDDSCFEKGMKVLVHIPIPRLQDTQQFVSIDKFYPEGAVIEKEDAEQRTIYWNVTLDKNEEFYVEYTFTHLVKYVDLEGKVGVDSDDFKEYTVEHLPHIAFTPFIKEITKEVTKDAFDPLNKARAIYDYITKNMRYGYQRDYFSMDNIPERCAKNHRGDCGVFALLFITMCRCAGIPAHWETCFAVESDDIGRHDWARFYVKPFGWLHADCSFGVGANRIGNEVGRKHYFGNLDGFRMVANSAETSGFANKKHWRFDPVDSQMGEIESETKGFKAGEFHWDAELIKFEEL